MNDRLHDELLSAYLDGEVTAAEQARAERLLVEDREAGRLFDELRTMRSCLQELPRQNLPEDFSARVLRSAEREMLQSPPAAAGQPRDVSPPQFSWRQRIGRPLAYASLVLAASLLIMIFANEKQGDEGPEKLIARQPPPVEAAREAEPPAMTAAPLPHADIDALRASESEMPALAKSAATKKEANTAGSGDAALFDQSAQGNKIGESLADRSSLMVVTCEITPAAARQDAFRQVLIRNSINLDVVTATAPAQTASAKPTSEAAQGLGLDEAKSGLEVVYVEASAAQLENTLAEMAAQPKDFLSVQVGAAENQSVQNRWQDRYSRGRGGLVQQRSLESNLATGAQKPAAGPAASNVPANSSQAGAPPAPAPSDEERRKNEAPPAQFAQQAGRARGYFMPAEGLNYQQRPGAPVMLQQQQPTAAGGAPAAAKEVQKRLDDAQRAPAPSRPMAEQNGAAEPANLRALFVLRVAKDPPAEAAAPAKPAEK